MGSGFFPPLTHSPMAAVNPAAEASAVALPGLGRALVSAGKLGQKAAEDKGIKGWAQGTASPVS